MLRVFDDKAVQTEAKVGQKSLKKKVKGEGGSKKSLDLTTKLLSWQH